MLVNPGALNLEEQIVREEEGERAQATRKEERLKEQEFPKFSRAPEFQTNERAGVSIASSR